MSDIAELIANIKNKKKIPVKNPYESLQIPETWSNVQEFAEWYIGAGMPIMPPLQTEIFLSDDATATALFRKGRFQVEMYLIHPKPVVPTHEHPGVEVIKMRMGYEPTLTMSTVLTNGHSHGAGFRMEGEKQGFPLMAFQHWLTRDPTTIASMWKGKTAGPIHDALIRRFNPDCYIVDGYADITRKQQV